MDKKQGEKNRSKWFFAPGLVVIGLIAIFGVVFLINRKAEVDDPIGRIDPEGGTPIGPELIDPTKYQSCGWNWYGDLPEGTREDGEKAVAEDINAGVNFGYNFENNELIVTGLFGWTKDVTVPSRTARKWDHDGKTEFDTSLGIMVDSSNSVFCNFEWPGYPVPFALHGVNQMATVNQVVSESKLSEAPPLSIGTIRVIIPDNIKIISDSFNNLEYLQYVNVIGVKVRGSFNVDKYAEHYTDDGVFFDLTK